MGQTNYVTLTTREYALLAHMEGVVRTLLHTPVASSYEQTGAARKALSETVAALEKVRAKCSG